MQRMEPYLIAFDFAALSTGSGSFEAQTGADHGNGSSGGYGPERAEA